MKSILPFHPSSFLLALFAAASLSAPSSGHAVDGTFSQTTAGTYTWSNTGNWSGGIVPGGSGATANLTSGTTGSYVLTLDTPVTLGNIINSTHGWSIQGPSTLTLAGTAPSITSSGPGITIGAVLAGTQGVTLNGVVTFNGANTYSGITRVETGTLTVGNAQSLGSAANGTEVVNGASLIVNNTTIAGETVTINGSGSGGSLGSLQARGSATWAGDVIIGNGSARIGTVDASARLTVSGQISGNFGLFTSGLGTVVLANANTYTGATQILRGTVKLASGNNRLPTATALTLGGTADSATFDLDGNSQQIARLINGISASSRTVTNSSTTAATLTLDGTIDGSFLGASGSTTAITGNLAIVKQGSYTQTLANTNSHRGNTAVNAGTLILADDATMTFYIGADGVNNAILGTGQIVLDGNFVFDLSQAVAIAGNSWLIVETSQLGSTFSDTFTVQGFTQNDNIWTSGSYEFSEATGLLTYAVPEPDSLALLLGGGLSLLVWRANRRQKMIL